MLPHNLAGNVTRQVLAATIPTRYTSRRIHHPDGIVLGFLDHQAEALLAFAQLLSGPLRAVVQLAQMCFAQPRVDKGHRLHRPTPQPIEREQHRDQPCVAFQYSRKLLCQQFAQRARRGEQLLNSDALMLRLVELAADYALDESLVVRERALGIALGQWYEEAPQERNGHPAQRLAHPRELVCRRVELYRFGPAPGYALEVRKQAARNFRH